MTVLKIKKRINMPLAKEAVPESQTVQQDSPITSHPQAPDYIMYEGVPFDVYQYFSTAIESSTPNDRDKLRDIYEFVKKDGMSIGDVMSGISDIENRLGLGGGERRFDRVWNWVRMSKHIKDIEARRASLERRA